MDLIIKIMKISF